MNTRFLSLVVASWIAISYTSAASAYLGPGLAAGTLAVILGLLGSLLVAGLAFFWYPIKRMFSGESERAEEDEDVDVAVAANKGEEKKQEPIESE